MFDILRTVYAVNIQISYSLQPTCTVFVLPNQTKCLIYLPVSFCSAITSHRWYYTHKNPGIELNANFQPPHSSVLMHSIRYTPRIKVYKNIF